MNRTPAQAEIPRAATPDQPWPGLAAFEEGDFDLFKGRDAAISALARLILREDLTFLWGLSGLGKTSLLRAGLFPRLREADIFPVYVRLRYEGDDRSLTEQCLDAIEEAAARWKYETPQRGRAGTLWEYARRRDQRFWSSTDRLVTPLLVFDQFEEIFNRGPIGASKEIAAFFADLSDTITGSTADEGFADGEYLFRRGVFKVLLSFREDFVAQVAKCAPLVTSIGHRYYRLESLTFEDAVTVVREGGGHLIENADPESHDRLCRLIVDHVAGTTDVASRSSATVDPALLSLYCSELNKRRDERSKDRISATLLEAGTAATIIPDFYEACMARVSPVSRDILERQLVLRKSRTRNSVAEEDLSQVKPDELGYLIDTRILRRDTTRQPRIEFTHDVLVAPAIEALTRRELARQRAEEEQRRLEEERRQADQLRTALEVQRQIAKAARRRMLGVSLTIILGLVLWRGIEFSREQTIRLLVQTSQDQLTRDPQLSALFSSWAAGAARRHGAEIRALAGDALNRSMRAASVLEARFETTGSRVIVNSTGTLATIMDDARSAVLVLTLSAPSATPREIKPTEGKSVSDVKFSADGKELLLLNTDASVDRVSLTDPAAPPKVMSTNRAGQREDLFSTIRQPKDWAVTSAGHVVVLSATVEYPQALAPPGDPTQFITIPVQTIRYWLSEADAGGDLFTERVSAQEVSDVILASGGARYAVIEHERTVTVKELGGQIVARRTFPPSRFEISADGTHVIAMPPLGTSGDQNTRDVMLWRVGDADASRVSLPGRDEVTATFFSPNGAFFAVVQAPGVAQFWQTASLKPIFPAPLPATSVRFSTDSRSAVTWGDARPTQLWRLDRDAEPTIDRRGDQERVTDLAFVGGSNRIAALTTSGLLVLTATPATAVARAFDTMPVGARVLALAPDGKALTVGGDNGAVTVSLADRTTHTTTIRGRVTALAYSAGTSNIAVATTADEPGDGSRTKAGLVVRGADGKTIGPDLSIRSGQVTAMAFVGRDRLVYLVETEPFQGRVELANLESGRVIHRECFTSSRVAGLSASKQGDEFVFGVFAPGYGTGNASGFAFEKRAIGGSTGTLDCDTSLAGANGPPRRGSAALSPVVPTPPPPPEPSVPTSPALNVEMSDQLQLPVSAISRDFTRAVTRSEPNDVNLWLGLERPEAAITLGQPVRAIAVSPDGGRFAAGGENGLVRLFDIDRRTDPLTLQPSGARVEAIAFSEDGGQLAVLDKEGQVTLHPVGVDELIQTARAILKGRVPKPGDCPLLGGWCTTDPTSFSSLLRRLLPLESPR